MGVHFRGRADYISHKYTYVKYNDEDVEDTTYIKVNKVLLYFAAFCGFL